jgi:hypothetical protein
MIGEALQLTALLCTVGNKLDLAASVADDKAAAKRPVYKS